MTAAVNRTTPRESTRTVIAKLNAVPGCMAMKRHGSVMGFAGDGDVTGCIILWPSDYHDVGQRFELEAKRQGLGPRKLQAARLRKWARVGAITGVFTCWADVVAIFRDHGIDLEGRDS